MSLLLHFLWTGNSVRSEPITVPRDLMGVMQQVRLDCGGDAACMLDASSRLLESAECGLQQVGFCIQAQLLPEETGSLMQRVEDCDETFWPFHYLRGNWFFEKGRIEDSFQEFVAAEQEGMEPKGVLFSNQGAAYFEMECMSEALVCFEESFDCFDDSEAPYRFMSLNNIAAIHLRFQQFEEALAWVAKAKANLELMSNSEFGFTSEYLNSVRFIVDANEWFARSSLGDSAFVRGNWRELEWGAWEIQPDDWLQLMFNVAPLMDEESFFVAQLRTLESLLQELGPRPDDPGMKFGIFALLLDYHNFFPDDIRGLMTAWMGVANLSRRLDGWESAPVATSATKSSFHWSLILCALIPFLALTYVLTRIFQARKYRKVSLKNRIGVLQMLINSKAKSHEIQQVLADIVSAYPTTLDPLDAFAQYELTESELEVLMSAQLRESPKDLALRKSWTPKYVYTMRSSVRKKLGIETEIPLEEWFAKQNVK